MEAEWLTSTFGSLMAVPTRNGIHKGTPFQGRGVPVVKMGEVYHADVIRDQARDLLDLTQSELDRLDVRANDLLFCRTSLVAEGVGHCAIVGHLTTRSTFASNLIRVRLDSRKADPRYWFYYFRSSVGKELLLSLARGTSVTTITGPDIAALNVLVPGISEQRAIAHTLGTLDNKIELNCRMSETLEAIALALFKSWFVDFDLIRANAEGRDIGMSKRISGLFKDFLKDSELGAIPRGWNVGTIGDVVEQLRDTENPPNFPETIYRHFSIPSYDHGQCPITELGANIKSLKFSVPADTILLSKLNPEIERVWLVDVEPEDRGVCSTEFLVLKPRPPFGRAYAYCAMRSSLFRQELEGLVTGTSKSHQRAQPDSILGLTHIQPQAAPIMAFEQIADPLLQRVLKCRRENRSLATLRDTLLPKLISGETRAKAKAA